MTLWEYSTATVANGTIPLDDLALMGKDGWELVTLISRPGLPERAIFKRPLPPTQGRVKATPKAGAK